MRYVVKKNGSSDTGVSRVKGFLLKLNRKLINFLTCYISIPPENDKKHNAFLIFSGAIEMLTCSINFQIQN